MTSSGDEPINFASITTAAELRRALDGRSSSELEQILEDVGPSEVLAKALPLIATRFRPSDRGTRSGFVHWRVRHRHGVETCWFGVDRAGGFAHGLGVPITSTVTIDIGLADFILLLANRLDPARALLTRRVKLRGDPTFAFGMRAWFPDR